MFKICSFWLSFIIVADTLSNKDTLEKSPSEEKYTAEQSDLQLLREKTTDRDGKEKT